MKTERLDNQIVLSVTASDGVSPRRVINVKMSVASLFVAIALTLASAPGDVIAKRVEAVQPFVRNFGFEDYANASFAETIIHLGWDSDSSGKEIQVLRAKIPLVAGASGPATFSLLPSQAITLESAWHVIGTTHLRYFEDKDIPPVNTNLPLPARRKLGASYCYKLRVPETNGVVETPAICRKLRGINRPDIDSIHVNSATEITVHWHDNSKLELGYRIIARREDGKTLVGTDRSNFEGPYRISGLLPNTKYCIDVQAFDSYGKSDKGSECDIKTPPAPMPVPTEHTYFVQLEPNFVNSGSIPYTALFPAFGIIPGGKLKKVQNVSGNPVMLFLKPGSSSTQCNNTSAGFVVQPGQELSSESIQTIYGSKTPSLPVAFLACVSATPPLLNTIPLKVTYTKTE